MILHFLTPPTAIVAPAAPRIPAVRVASYYANHYDGHHMADGERFRQTDHTCASNDWPLGTRLRVSYGKSSVRVRVTDRMAHRFTGQRIDLSKSAFLALSPLAPGIIPVDVTVID